MSETQTLTEEKRRRLVERLRLEQPESRKLKPEQLDALVDRACQNALELEIFDDDDDVYRFVKLWFLPAEFLQLPLIQGVLFRVLNNLALPANSRLDFIERQVLRRLKS